MSASSLHRRAGATPLARYIPGVTFEALRRHGFGNYELIANWTAIAGPSLSSYALPLRLTRPFARQSTTDVDDVSLREVQGATLILKVDPARSLEIQYLAPQLIERINACLGYKAVSAIRIVQVPLGIALPARRAPTQLASQDAPAASAPPENRLAQALDRLTRNRTARRNTLNRNR
jgi:hypothetical protein